MSEPQSIQSPHPLRQQVTVDLRTVTDAQAVELIDLMLERAPGTLRIIEHIPHPEMGHLPDTSPGYWTVQPAIRWEKVAVPDDTGGFHWNGQIEVHAENGSHTVGFPADVLRTLLIHNEWEAQERARAQIGQLVVPMAPQDDQS